MTLANGNVCTFEDVVADLCTCNIRAVLMVTAILIGGGRVVQPPGRRRGGDNRHESPQRCRCCGAGCEGRSGVVSKGSMRGNEVAIKKMKEEQASEEAMVELSKGG